MINEDDSVAAHWYGLAISMQKLGCPLQQYREMLEQAYLRAPREWEIAWWFAHELYLERDADRFAFVARPLLRQASNESARARLQPMIMDLEGSEPLALQDEAGNTLGGTVSKYRGYSAYKALALAFDYRGAYALGYVFDSPDQQTANIRAVAMCESHRNKNGVEVPCRVYAEGDAWWAIRMPPGAVCNQSSARLLRQWDCDGNLVEKGLTLRW